MNIKLNKPFAANSAVDEFDVRQIKKALNRLGYYQPYEKTGITGIPDAAVFEALKAFQKDRSTFHVLRVSLITRNYSFRWARSAITTSRATSCGSFPTVSTAISARA